jgi:hypothetical protein
MSIWTSIAEIGTADGWDHDNADGTVRTFADGWSNHYPRRGASPGTATTTKAKTWWADIESTPSPWSPK